MTDKTSSIILDDPSLFVFKIALLKSSRDASYKWEIYTFEYFKLKRIIKPKFVSLFSQKPKYYY